VSAILAMSMAGRHTRVWPRGGGLPASPIPIANSLTEQAFPGVIRGRAKAPLGPGSAVAG